jgi:hypothetical protein
MQKVERPGLNTLDALRRVQVERNIAPYPLRNDAAENCSALIRGECELASNWWGEMAWA